MTLTQEREAGYVVARDILNADEVERLRTETEGLLERVTAKTTEGVDASKTWADGHRLDEVDGVTVHWEPDAENPTVRSLSPVTHLSQAMDALWSNPRLTEAVKSLNGASELGPFGSTLNFKRAGAGSSFLWHQDYPYWYCCVGESATDIVTAIVFVDDATTENGPLEVIPGSHLGGPVRRDRSEGTGLLVDESVIDPTEAVTIEASAGSALCFPGLLVHRSGPNRSTRDRRTLLLRFQPAGRPQLRDVAYDEARLADLP